MYVFIMNTTIQENRDCNVSKKPGPLVGGWKSRLGALGSVLALSVLLMGCSATEQGASYGGGGGAVIGGALGGWPGAAIGGAAGALAGSAVGAAKDNADKK